MRVGAQYLGDGKCEFTVWSPLSADVRLRISSPVERTLKMSKDDFGYWRASAAEVLPGTIYDFQLPEHTNRKISNGVTPTFLNRPDPASHFQPQGVHGPSAVVDHTDFKWDDTGWAAVPLEEVIVYELHTGTFTSAGTFEAVIGRLEEIRDLGVNAIEIMPVAQFPGERNWGYDGSYPFAVQNSYGGPEGLKRLINACHLIGISVIMDVVYNHLGPEGNYLESFAPYFTSKYNTPWGKAVNFDDRYSYGVRNYFIENALYWLRDYHIDALRLDAIHAIRDMSAKHFLQELADAVECFSEEQGRKFYLIAESDLNDVRIIHSKERRGYGIDAQWSDDFHHSLHALVTGERQGYYEDFGSVKHLVKAFEEGFVYSGQYSRFRKRNHGSSSADLPARQFIVCAQNHDQVGNRALGERLSALVSFETLKLTAGAVVLSPYIPLLFMGEEYGEESPFPYFVSHGDEELIEAVRRGRRAEFEEFDWEGRMNTFYCPPDPQSLRTFLGSKLDWKKRNEGKHGILREFYRSLIELRKNTPALSRPGKENLRVWALEGESLVFWRRWKDASHAFCVMNFAEEDVIFQKEDSFHQAALPSGKWKKVLDSAEERWSGSGAWLPDVIEEGDRLTARGRSIALYEREA